MSGAPRSAGRELLVEIGVGDLRVLLGTDVITSIVPPVGCALAHGAVSAACYDADNLKCYHRPFGAGCSP